MTRIKILITFFVLSVSAHAQSAWSLQQCIDYALTNNLTVKQSELNVELTHVGVNQNAANLFPTLNGFGTNNYYFGRSIDPYTNLYTNQQVRSNSFGLSSNLSLFEGFMLVNTLKQSKLDYMSSKMDLQKVKNDMALNVATVYLQVLYNRELLTVADEQFKATKVQRDRTKRMEELGSMSKGNLLDMESQLATDEVRLVTAQSAYDQSMLSLKQLLELDTVSDFSIIVPELPAPTLDAAYSDAHAIYLTALTNQPDIKSYEYKIGSAEKGLSIARGAMYPKLSMNASVGTTYSTSSRRVKDYTTTTDVQPTGYTSSQDTVFTIFNEMIPNFEYIPFNDQFDNNLNKTIGFSLNIPIFNGMYANSNIRRAKINLKQTQLGFDLAKKSMFKSIEQAVADANAAYQRFISGEKNVSATEQSMNFNQQRFDLGLISTYDYLLTKNNYIRAKSDLLQAKFDYIFRLKVLDFYMGKPLAF